MENAIDEKAVLGYIGNALALTPEWIPILTEGFNKCNKELIIRSNEFKYKQGDCLAGPGFIMGCLHSHVIQFCPKNVWNSCEYQLYQFLFLLLSINSILTLSS